MEAALIIFIVALAISYVIYRTWKSVKKGSACGCDCSCSRNEQNCLTEKNIHT